MDPLDLAGADGLTTRSKRILIVISHTLEDAACLLDPGIVRK